jgi:hypothetical protein
MLDIHYYKKHTLRRGHHPEEFLYPVSLYGLKVPDCGAVWTNRDKNGRPVCVRGRKRISVARFTWQVFHGPIPHNMTIRHKDDCLSSVCADPDCLEMVLHHKHRADADLYADTVGFLYTHTRDTVLDLLKLRRRPYQENIDESYRQHLKKARAYGTLTTDECFLWAEYVQNEYDEDSGIDHQRSRIEDPARFVYNLFNPDNPVGPDVQLMYTCGSEPPFCANPFHITVAPLTLPSDMVNSLIPLDNPWKLEEGQSKFDKVVKYLQGTVVFIKRHK